MDIQVGLATEGGVKASASVSVTGTLRVQLNYYPVFPKGEPENLITVKNGIPYIVTNVPVSNNRQSVHGEA